MDGWMAIFYSTVLLVGVSLKPKINFNVFENKAHPLATVIPYSSILLQLMKHEKKPKVLPHPPNSLNASVTQHP